MEQKAARTTTVDTSREVTSTQDPLMQQDTRDTTQDATKNEIFQTH